MSFNLWGKVSKDSKALRPYLKDFRDLGKTLGPDEDFRGFGPISRNL